MNSTLTGSTGLLERCAELDRVRTLIDACASGSGAALAIEGPAGIGKTAVLEEAVRLGAESRVRTVLGTGSELEGDYAFGGVRQLLGGLVADIPLAGQAELFEFAAAPAAAVLGLHGLTPWTTSSPQDPAAAMHALYWLVANLAEHRPLLLVADDVQWYDSPSLRFLAYMARRLSDLGVSLLMATRPTGSSSDVLSALLSDERLSVMTLAPLSEEAVGQVIATRWKRVADPRFVTACHRAGGGNPFLTSLLLRALDDANVEPTPTGAKAVLPVGADAVRRQVLGRLARRPASVELVRAVAVLGSDATIRHIAALADVQPEAVAAAIEQLSVTGLVVADQPVRLAHPLVRSAIYQDMTPALRAWWHAKAARILADHGAAPDRAASHLMLVEPDGDPWVVDVLIDAAAAANQRGAPDVASALYRRALAEPAPPTHRWPLLLHLGSAERAAGEEASVEHLAEALATAEEDAAKVDAGLQLRATLVTLGRPVEAVAVLDQLHGEIVAESTRQIIAAGIVLTALASPHAAPTARQRLDEFVRLAVAEDRESLAPPIAAIAATASWFANCPVEIVDELVASAFTRRLERQEPIVPPWWAPPLALTALSVDHADAAAILDWVVSTLVEQGELARTGLLLAFRGLHRERIGALAAAAADAEAAVEACKLAGQRHFLAVAVAVRTACHVERGELAGARELLAAHGYTGPLDDVMMYNSYLAHARGRLNLAQGHVSEAIADLRDAGRRLDLCSAITPSFLPWRSDLAIAFLANRSRAEAMALASEELELARAFGAPRGVGIALRAVGLASVDPEVCERRLREAVAVLTDGLAPVELARALLDLGTMLRRRGARVEARKPLSQSLDLASSCGALVLAERARAELVAVGARPRRARLVSVDALTVTEARAAGMAAGAATNKQIAQAMFVTVKTVETHLAHAYQKLGISKRTQLAAALKPADT